METVFATINNIVGLRDYHAANAPKMPGWFVYPRPKLPDEWTDQMKDFAAMRYLIIGRYIGMTEEQADTVRAFMRNHEEKKQIAWQYYYADAMIAGRGNKG